MLGFLLDPVIDYGQFHQLFKNIARATLHLLNDSKLSALESSHCKMFTLLMDCQLLLQNGSSNLEIQSVEYHRGHKDDHQHGGSCERLGEIGRVRELILDQHVLTVFFNEVPGHDSYGVPSSAVHIGLGR